MAQTAFQRDNSTNCVVLQSIDGKKQTSILCSMYNNEASLYDVTITGSAPSPSTGDAIDTAYDLQPIRAHKAILAQASKHLHDLFTVQGYVDSNKANYTISDIDHGSLRDIVKFIYTNAVELQDGVAAERVRGIFIGAKYLIMNDLTNACETFLCGGDQLNAKNCIDAFQFAFKYKCYKLLDVVCAFIANNLLAIIQTSKFLQLSQEECAKFLLSEPVVAAKVNYRCRAAIAWLNHESPSRTQSAECIMTMAALDADGVSFDTLLLAAESAVIRHTIKGISLKLIDAFANKVRRNSLIPAPEAPMEDDVVFLSHQKGETWYVIGGQEQQTAFYRYEVTQRQWIVMEDELPWKRIAAGACAVGHRLVVMGGTKNNKHSTAVDEFDTVTQSWSMSSAKLSHPRAGVAVTANSTNHAYVLGGYRNPTFRNVTSASHATAERYSFRTRKLEKLGDMINARHCAAAACGVNDTIFVVGGSAYSKYGGHQLCPPVDKYDPTTQSWSTIAKLDRPRGNLAAVFVGDDLYVIGGGESNFVDILNTHTGQLRVGPQLTQARDSCAALALDNNVVCVLGGLNDEDVELKSVDAYDVREGKWSTGVIVPDMPSGNADFACARVLH